MLGFLRFADQLIDRLAGKQLAGQGSGPRFESGGLSDLVHGGLCILRVPEWLAPGRNPLKALVTSYRLETPRAAFLSFFLFSPRGPVRFALGAAFLRAVRFTFLRSSLSSILVVSATYNLFSLKSVQGFPHIGPMIGPQFYRE